MGSSVALGGSPARSGPKGVAELRPRFATTSGEPPNATRRDGLLRSQDVVKALDRSSATLFTPFLACDRMSTVAAPMGVRNAGLSPAAKPLEVAPVLGGAARE